MERFVAETAQTGNKIDGNRFAAETLAYDFCPTAMKPQRFPMRPPDGFLIAMDAFMRRTGQGAHASQSLLELDRAPDVAALQRATRRVVEKHPLLIARVRRHWLTLLPYWNAPTTSHRHLPLGLWREEGSPGQLGPEAKAVPNPEEFLTGQMQPPYESEDGTPPAEHHVNARLDVLEWDDGRCHLALSWSHVLMDGKGAELLLAELARLCEGVDLDCTVPESGAPKMTFREKFRLAGRAVRRMAELSNLGVRSLSGPEPRAGKCCFQVLTLNRADTAAVRARAVDLTGSLFPLPFYLAGVMRAHNAVFIRRGVIPKNFVAAVPVQMRRRGARGPIFNNHMTILFFSAQQEDLLAFETMAAALKLQFVDMMRKRLDASFAMILEMMLRAPSRLFMKIVRLQFGGEISSFFHSHTGGFAPDMSTFAGAGIENANHLPCLGAPPGTGIFFADRGERINITLSWREGCVSAEERSVMMRVLLTDLLGAERPELWPLSS